MAMLNNQRVDFSDLLWSNGCSFLQGGDHLELVISWHSTLPSLYQHTIPAIPAFFFGLEIRQHVTNPQTPWSYLQSNNGLAEFSGWHGWIGDSPPCGCHQNGQTEHHRFPLHFVLSEHHGSHGSCWAKKGQQSGAMRPWHTLGWDAMM